MNTIRVRPSQLVSAAIAAIALAVPVMGCHQASEPTGIDLSPFKAMAAASDCDDVRNKLYLIDDTSVFWDREGSCIDMLYTFALYGGTPSEILCERHDSLGGGNVTNCPDESYRPLFDTIIANRDQSDLGLGGGHVVESIPF